MNEFEKRINALRIQYRDERIQITKDCARTIGHLNTAIGKVNTPEARQALRAEKARVYEAARTSIDYNLRCYSQQLEAIEDEYRLHLERNPSGKRIRRMIGRLCKAAEAKGETSVTLSFGENRRATVSFA